MIQSVRRRVLVLSALLLLAGAAGSQAQAQRSGRIVIGTGGVTGVYYPAGGAICRLVNQRRQEHGIRCGVESTEGSVYNVNGVLSGDLDLGIVQSDVQWRAWHGHAPFTQEQTALRSLFSVHPETAILVARTDAGIRQAADIRGKRVNIGNTGSGTFATALVILAALGLTQDDLALAGDFSSSDHGQALHDGRLDAFFFLVGHPSGGLKDVFYTTDALLVPLQGPGFDALVEKTPYYVKASTPGGLYRGVPDAVPAFAVKATLVTREALPDAVAYAVTQAVFADLAAFTQQHPAFTGLTAERMLTGNSAPLHPGAARYFREAGLLHD